MSLRLRPVLFTLHSYLAIAVGLYVAILGITGAIMAFETEIDRLANSKITYVTPAPPRLSFAQLGDDVAKAYPGQKISFYDIGDAPNLSTVVLLGSTSGLPALSVYVNPYTGEILGSRATGLTVLDFIHSFHQRLTAPRPGRDRLTRSFVSWISVIALFLVVSGVWLWWPSKRFAIRAPGGRPFWFDVHASFGIAAAAFLILLTLTGMGLGFESSTKLLYALAGSQASPPLRVPPPTVDAKRPITIDRAFAIASDALPGARPFLIAGLTPRGTYVVNARTPADQGSVGRPALIVINQYGAVLSAEDPGAAPGARLVALNRAIHIGDVFGIPTKAIMALASLTISFQAVTGIVMWIKRASLRSMVGALVATAAVSAIAVYTVLASR